MSLCTAIRRRDQAIAREWRQALFRARVRQCATMQKATPRGDIAPGTVYSDGRQADPRASPARPPAISETLKDRVAACLSLAAVAASCAGTSWRCTSGCCRMVETSDLRMEGAALAHREARVAGCLGAARAGGLWGRWRALEQPS